MSSAIPSTQHAKAPFFVHDLPDSVSESHRLLHELRVHQIELEMQNDALRQAHELIETSLAHYTNLYNFSPAGCFTLGPQGLILQANLAGLSLLRRSEAVVLGCPFATFVHTADQAPVWGLLKQVFASQPHQPLEAMLLDEGLAPCHVQIDARLQPDGQTCLVTVVDTCDRVMLSVERQHVADLSAAYQVAEAATLAKSAFLSSMSHELRTPLNAILGFSQLLQMDRLHPLDPHQASRLQAVQVAGQHLLRLVEDVLDLSLIESGGLRVDCTPVDVDQVLDDAIKLVTPMLPVHNVSLVVAWLGGAEGARHMVHADKTRLTQVFVNLLSNAIKYNVKGGSVRVEVTQQEPDMMRVGVVDSGPGMTPEQQSQLFQPFNRLGREHSEVPGTGIGLLITQRLLHLMGGRLLVESTPGQGSRFEVQVALAKPVLN